jgi:hypothetical protein
LSQYALKDLLLVDNQLSVSFIAGIKLLDVFRDHFWNQYIFEQTFSKNFIEDVANDLMHFSFEDYGLRNLQAQLIAKCLHIAYNHHRSAMADLVENLTDEVTESENKY